MAGKQKRNPGPLSVSPDGVIRNGLSFQDPDHWDETYVSFSGRFGSYGANLFAQAPELLALLKETLRPGAYGIGSTLSARIEAAIAKAECR